MEILTSRLLPDEIADGAHNMAADEVLLQSATGGMAAATFYLLLPYTGYHVEQVHHVLHAQVRDDGATARNTWPRWHPSVCEK